jgi:CheY-like chemotaxis protein
MTAQLLRGFHILIVEDEFLLASALCHTLQDAGAVVVGPANSVNSALALLDTNPILDGAVLDINLRGEMVFPVADVLARRGTPFVFATGYGEDMAPERYSFVPYCQKPVEAVAVAEALQKAILAFLSPSARRRRLMGLPD